MTTEYLNNKAFERLIIAFQEAKKKRLKYEFLLDDIRTTENRVQKRGKYKKPTSWNTIEQIFSNATHEYQNTQQDLATVFYTLSQNIVRYAKFNLIDEDDAIQEGVLICFEKIDRFDPKKGKAFNYMTTCILNHFRQLYRTARNYNELKRKYLDFLNIQLEQPISQKTKNNFKKHNITPDA
jgi:DNA-directed RNA polymerase specialized sigma subunit